MTNRRAVPCSRSRPACWPKGSSKRLCAAGLKPELRSTCVTQGVSSGVVRVGFPELPTLKENPTTMPQTRIENIEQMYQAATTAWETAMATWAAIHRTMRETSDAMAWHLEETAWNALRSAVDFKQAAWQLWDAETVELRTRSIAALKGQAAPSPPPGQRFAQSQNGGAAYHPGLSGSLAHERESVRDAFADADMEALLQRGSTPASEFETGGGQ